jgi:hypothetical protein
VRGRRSPGRSIVLAAAVAFLLQLSAMAVEPSWTRPVAPQRIVGNLYYVGSEELVSFLVLFMRGARGVQAEEDARSFPIKCGTWETR